MMNVSQEKRYEYWNHFITRAFVQGHLPSGVTGPRLRQVKAAIMIDDHFWQDIIVRHGGLHNSPEHLAEYREADYEHCLGNFWGMLCHSMSKTRLLK